MSRRFPAPARRSPVGVRHLLALVALVLVTASGTAFTASLQGVPSVSVEAQVTDFPDFTVSGLYFDDQSGQTTAYFTVTSSRPTVPARQVLARVRTVAAPGNPFQPCTAVNPQHTSWTCPVPGMTAVEATAGTFAYFANP